MLCAEKNYECPEWSNDLALQLIDEYEKFPVLWDSKNLNHFSKNKKADAWEVISLNMKVDVPQCIQKMNSLLGSFRREKKKGKKSIGTGKARKEIYITKWYAFERMNYLLDKDEPRTTVDTEKEDNEEQQPDSDQTSSNLDIEQNASDERDHSFNQNESEPFSSAVTPMRKRKASDKKDDARLEEAFKILKESVSKKEIPPDYCATYSQHVANKLRSYSVRTRSQVENAINNILFHADMGGYENPPPNPFPQYSSVSQYPANFHNVPAPLPSTSPSYTSTIGSTPNMEDNELQIL